MGLGLFLLGSLCGCEIEIPGTYQGVFSSEGQDLTLIQSRGQVLVEYQGKAYDFNEFFGGDFEEIYQGLKERRSGIYLASPVQIQGKTRPDAKRKKIGQEKTPDWVDVFLISFGREGATVFYYPAQREGKNVDKLQLTVAQSIVRVESGENPTWKIDWSKGRPEEIQVTRSSVRLGEEENLPYFGTY